MLQCKTTDSRTFGQHEVVLIGLKCKRHKVECAGKIVVDMIRTPKYVVRERERQTQRDRERETWKKISRVLNNSNETKHLSIIP